LGNIANSINRADHLLFTYNDNRRVDIQVVPSHLDRPTERSLDRLSSQAKGRQRCRAFVIVEL